MQTQRATRSRPSPGILKVFWPAFLGWGTAALWVAGFKSRWFVEYAPDWGRDAVETGFMSMIPISRLLGLGVTITYREKAGPWIVLNLSTFLLYALSIVP